MKTSRLGISRAPALRRAVTRSHAVTFALALAATTLSRASAQTLVLETADASANAAGLFSSLALDASGNPHVSYLDNIAFDLKYAYKSAGVWTIETVDGSANSVGWYTSLALDAAGNPHVSYQDATTGDLKYARKAAGLWTLVTADTSANVVGVNTSLALDASGNAHVSYFDDTVDDLKYARISGGAWVIETVDATNLMGLYSSLALDASGNPHVGYYYATGTDLKYARKSGGTWTIETADGTAGRMVGSYTSLALDATGNPHVSYYDDTTDDLKYARKSGGVWTRETADGSANSVGLRTSIALDALGNPHVSYWDNTLDNLKYARKAGGAWTIETMDGSGNDVGSYSSLKLDALGNPHVGYYDATLGDLKYAYIPSVLITSPQAGAIWAVGSEQAIAWSFTGGLPIDNSDVYLSFDGGNSFTQIRNEARDPGMTLRVPHTPTRFASIKIIRPSPYTEAYMDSFFAIDASIALSKFDARAVDGGGVRAVALTWKTTPGREADIRYRLERAATDDPAAAFTALTAEPLNSTEYVDAGVDAASTGAPSSTRYRLIAINGLGEEYVLGTTGVSLPLATDAVLRAAPNVTRDGGVTILFRGDASADETEVAIYDVAGRRVRTVSRGARSSQLHSAIWDGRDEDGMPVASGAYFARLSWGGLPRATERVVVVR